LTQRFTGKERDSESGVDFFEARYMSSAQGRFTNSDPSGAAASSRSDPQSWNMYAYGRNNPLLYVDPDGLIFRICDTSGNCDYNYSDSNFDQNFNNGKGISFDGQDIYQNGTLIGTYERLSFDDLGLMGNSLFQGMAARRQASNQFIAGFAVSSAAVGAAGGAIAGAGSALPSQGALGLAGKIGARLLPVGVTLQQFANNIIKWGKDAGGNAVSLARIATLNLEELKSAGITREIAQPWQQFYSYAAQMNPPT
jgi:RHS repeat-associated protein